jgi:transcription elongation factor Elf1
LGRRRRRVVKVVKRKVPTVFLCPLCGEEAVRVFIDRSGHARVQCGSCGIREEFDVSPSEHMVDVYCKFTDKHSAP